jgi:alanyl-tRNA synthetase
VEETIMNATVTETVVRTGEIREIDPALADGIIDGSEGGGYVVRRLWDRAFYMASVFRPGAERPMLIYMVWHE